MTSNQLDNGIRLLEAGLKIHLSREQKAIVEYNVKSPVLVNACAGAGKTMLFLFIALCLIVTKRCRPYEVLGVTFSKRAQIDMNSRYENDVKKLSKVGGNKLIGYGHPLFTTFHALFYRLLRMLGKYRNVQVLPSYQPISYFLSKQLPYPSRLESKAEMLKTIFQQRSQLINHSYTYDGIHLNRERKDVQIMLQQHIHDDNNKKNYYDAFEGNLMELNPQAPKDTDNKKKYKNYHQVVQSYNYYKVHQHLIDFTDMEVDLLKVLEDDPKAKQTIKRALSPIKFVFLDEFQDINDVQWHLMRQILSKVALSHIVTIGDDDQSIYSFRGSNPKIILEYHHNYPQSHTFNLSTNFRTGGNILDTVRPLITSNHYRLNKKLRTGRPKQGTFHEIFSNDRRYSANDILLKHLIKQIKDPKIKNEDIAVLVHYNNSRMFVIDRLASQGQYANVTNNDYILQNNYIYKIYMGIMQGLVFNNFSYIYKYATRIGFSKYKIHIYNILVAFHLKHVDKLSQYCVMAKEYDRKFSSKTPKDILGKDNAMIFYIKALMHPIKQGSQHMGADLWSAVCGLTNDYFQFMCKKRYMNKKMVKSIKNYLTNEFNALRTIVDVKKFFINEYKKKKLLNKKGNINQHPIHIMSLHQSKGLQFKYVYMYDINARRDSEGEVNLNRCFKPNMAFIDFLNFLMQSSKGNLSKVDDLVFGTSTASKQIPFTYTSLSNKIQNFIAKSFLQPNRFIQLIEKHHLTNGAKQNALQSEIWHWYHQTTHSSSFIEEQRRLIYVGITRAQQVLYLAYNRDADPLLNELAVPNKDKYYLEPSRQLLNFKQNQTYQKLIRQMQEKLNH